MDDSLLWDNTVEENFASVCKFLQIYGKVGLIVNGDKFQFGQDTVDFAGMQVTNSGVKPSKEFLEVIMSRSSPTNIKEVRAFYGLVNQVNWAFCKTEVMEPFRHLLRPGTPFKWTPDLQDKFEQAKVARVQRTVWGPLTRGRRPA